MAADIHIAGYSLTPAEWAALEPRTRSQLLLPSLPRDQPWLAHSPTAPMPVPTVQPGPDPGTVVIHAAAPPRSPASHNPRRAARTSDLE